MPIFFKFRFSSVRIQSKFEIRSFFAALNRVRRISLVLTVTAPLTRVTSPFQDGAGQGFEDTGGELEIYDMGPEPQRLAVLQTASRFGSIAWSQYTHNGQYPLGVIAGGMMDGQVHLWDASLVLEAAQQGQNSHVNVPPFHSVSQQGSVQAMHVSSIEPFRLATGGSEGQVVVVNLQTKASEPVGTQKSQVTAVAWNTQVAHICASAGADGSVSVWDLNSKKLWCELRCEAVGQPVSDLCWNPVQGLHLITASKDDRNPTMKMWDLGASTSMPLATLSGHHAGLLYVSWCPHDESLLLTCSRDNKTLLWDLTTLQPIMEVPNEAVAAEASHQQPNTPTSIFASSTLAEQKHMRYQVSWSPVKRGVALTCSLDRKVQTHSVIPTNRPPKWMTPSSSVSMGFGGTIVSCGKADRTVKIDHVVEDSVIVNLSREYESHESVSDVIQSGKAGPESDVWGFMEVMFTENARQNLLQHLGYDFSIISEKASSMNGAIETTSKTMGAAAQEAVQQALVVGNFEAAVEICFSCENYGDALVLASCGGGELWGKTQARFFEEATKQRPYLKTAGAILRGQLSELVASSGPLDWKETLGILATYGTSDEFPTLCIQLGDKLSASSMPREASFCHMCALDLNKTIAYWISQLLDRGKTVQGLHEFIVKVSVFSQAVSSQTELPEDAAELFSEYSMMLADQGLFAEAAKYCRGSSFESMVLRDRLYRGRSSQACVNAMGFTPEFPYSMQLVEKSKPQPQQSRQRPTTSQSASSVQVPRSVDQLPEGWISLQDPTSDRTYFANQYTGETTWDDPRSVHQPVLPASASAAHHQPSGYQSHDLSSQSNPNQISNGGHKHSLASKYGDGFVSSASRPELASQYGNVGTSNPYNGAAEPIEKQSLAQKAPVSTTWNLDQVEVSTEHVPIKETLQGFVEALAVERLQVAEKRLLIEAEKGVAVLVKRIARGDLDSELLSKVHYLVDALSNRDFASAISAQTSIVASYWREHKDWLKGLKALIQLVQKKRATPGTYH